METITLSSPLQVDIVQTGGKKYMDKGYVVFNQIRITGDTVYFSMGEKVLVEIRMDREFRTGDEFRFKITEGKMKIKLTDNQEGGDIV
jgi:hypothetical protein